MNEPIPLPLVDGALWIDNSMLENLQTCPRLCYYRNVLKRTPSTAKSALNFGSAAHRWLKFRYRFCPEDPTTRDVTVMERLLVSHLRLHPQPADEWRNLQLAVGLMRRYNEIYMVEPWQVLQTKRGPFVEFPFAYRLHEVVYQGVVYPIYFMGRIDLGVEMEHDPYIVDHKTTSMLGPSFFEDMGMSAQPRGYCWAYRKATGKCPRGYVINAIRGRKPALDLAKSKKKLVEDDDFQRERYYVDDAMLDEWEDNTKLLIEEFVWWTERGVMPMKTKWCVGKYGRCDYYDVCSLPLSNRQAMLESGQFEDNQWSPLNKTK